jgi:beta-phosphoglucomutase
MVKAVIFDLDGVLAKTDSLHYLSWKRISESHHLNFDKDLNNLLRGVSREECLKIILDHNKARLNEEDFNKICDEESKNYAALALNVTPNDLFPNTIEILKSIKQSGVKLAIGSGSKHAQIVIDKLGIRKFFDVIVDGTMFHNPKPDPECFMLCARLLKINPVDALVVEDADSGILAANAGGFNSVATRQTSDNVVADHYIDKLDDVLLLIK